MPVVCYSDVCAVTSKMRLLMTLVRQPVASIAYTVVCCQTSPDQAHKLVHLVHLHYAGSSVLYILAIYTGNIYIYIVCYIYWLYTLAMSLIGSTTQLHVLMLVAMPQALQRALRGCTGGFGIGVCTQHTQYNSVNSSPFLPI